MEIKKTRLLDIDISQITLDETIYAITGFLGEKRTAPALINNVNVHAFFLSFSNDVFRKVLNHSDIVFCDGFGVKLAAKILRVDIGERMTPPDWIDRLFEECAINGFSIYFLGDEEPVGKRFVDCVQQRHPKLRIVGYHHGFFDKSGKSNRQLVETINASGTHLLVTGMGMPIQEIWAAENQAYLGVNAVLATGALFRWYVGEEKRGPRMMTDNGFEWLWRFFVQPRKVWKRYVVELPYFFGVVIAKWAKSWF
ncbi:WecB/TagA/CpsF family glycosyltransferase [Paracnuella aquatica]|uniref:WecB/TagA/CpsF family glycosyltransferase n=1 Tax=Paracnuella aquatica TaxID=2268757 RepID=UPI000DEF59C6|nr:WecB/TagA/CpsF family glycosyltransferase [Paracnuella aquatica]RPD51028.1 glycosyltransferase [Paracnuella aquatica]